MGVCVCVCGRDIPSKPVVTYVKVYAREVNNTVAICPPSKLICLPSKLSCPLKNGYHNY